MIEVGWK